MCSGAGQALVIASLLTILQQAVMKYIHGEKAFLETEERTKIHIKHPWKKMTVTAEAMAAGIHIADSCTRQACGHMGLFEIDENAQAIVDEVNAKEQQGAAESKTSVGYTTPAAETANGDKNSEHSSKDLFEHFLPPESHHWFLHLPRIFSRTVNANKNHASNTSLGFLLHFRIILPICDQKIFQKIPVAAMVDQETKRKAAAVLDILGINPVHYEFNMLNKETYSGIPTSDIAGAITRQWQDTVEAHASFCAKKSTKKRQGGKGNKKKGEESQQQEDTAVSPEDIQKIKDKKDKLLISLSKNFKNKVFVQQTTYDSVVPEEMWATLVKEADSMVTKFISDPTDYRQLTDKFNVLIREHDLSPAWVNHLNMLSKKKQSAAIDPNTADPATDPNTADPAIDPNTAAPATDANTAAPATNPSAAATDTNPSESAAKHDSNVSIPVQTMEQSQSTTIIKHGKTEKDETDEKAITLPKISTVELLLDDDDDIQMDKNDMEMLNEHSSHFNENNTNCSKKLVFDDSTVDLHYIINQDKKEMNNVKEKLLNMYGNQREGRDKAAARIRIFNDLLRRNQTWLPDQVTYKFKGTLPPSIVEVSFFFSLFFLLVLTAPILNRLMQTNPCNRKKL